MPQSGRSNDGTDHGLRLNASNKYDAVAYHLRQTAVDSIIRGHPHRLGRATPARLRRGCQPRASQWVGVSRPGRRARFSTVTEKWVIPRAPAGSPRSIAPGRAGVRRRHVPGLVPKVSAWNSIRALPRTRPAPCASHQCLHASCGLRSGSPAENPPVWPPPARRMGKHQSRLLIWGYGPSPPHSPQ